jgi:hypothetical protein
MLKKVKKVPASLKFTRKEEIRPEVRIRSAESE